MSVLHVGVSTPGPDWQRPRVVNRQRLTLVAGLVRFLCDAEVAAAIKAVQIVVVLFVSH